MRKAAAFLLVILLLFVTGCLKRSTAPSEPEDISIPETVELTEDELWEKFNDALSIYQKVISENLKERINDIPENVFFPASGEDVYFRRSAENFFSATGGRAASLDGISVLNPQAGQVIGNPVEVEFWHQSDHYRGCSIVVTDENYKELARAHPPEAAHINVMYLPYTVSLAYQQPATSTGYIVLLTWDAKDGEQDFEEGRFVPVVFRGFAYNNSPLGQEDIAVKGITCGVDGNRVIEVLGEPLSVGGHEIQECWHGSGNLVYWEKWEYNELEFLFYTVRGPADPVPEIPERLYFIYITGGDYETHRGIRTGDPLSKVFEQYGRRERQSGQNTFTYEGYNLETIFFVIEEDSVVRIELGQPFS